MAKPINIYGPLRQAKDALGVLGMLTDPDKIREVKGVLAGIETERKRLNEAIANYSKTREIDGLCIKAEAAAAQAEKELAEARTAAAKIKSDADEWLDRADNNLTQRDAKSQAREVAVAGAEKAFNQRTEALEAAMSKREEAAAKALAKGERLIREGAALKDRYEKALEAHKQLAAAA